MLKVKNSRNQIKTTLDIFNNKLTQAKIKYQDKVDKTLHSNINKRKMNKNDNG